ncbi:MAG: chromate efflux transporter [Pirellulales bacterium]
MESPRCHDLDPRPSLAALFGDFLKLGLTAFGGPAMVAYIRALAVERKRWLGEESFNDGVALCQAIPGATAMQTAAYVGLRARGVRGAAMAFVGFGLPAFCLMMALSALYQRALHLSVATSAFAGLRAVVVAIVANAAVSFGRRSIKTWQDALVAAFAAVLFGLKASPILVIGAAALAGLVIYRANPVCREAVGLSGPFASKRPLVLLLAAAAGFFLALFLANRGLFDVAALMSEIDLLAFGGGYASVPLMYHEVVDTRGWMDGATFLNGIALGQVTPGPIVITATFVGYWVKGWAGGVVASVAVFLPSFLLVVGLVPYYDRLRENAIFQRCTAGVLASFVGLLAAVAFHFAGNVPWDLTRGLLAGAAFVALALKVEVPLVILVALTISMLAL